MIRKRGSLYYVLSHDGRKTLSRGYPTREEAVKRLQQIETFKEKKK